MSPCDYAACTQLAQTEDEGYWFCAGHHTQHKALRAEDRMRQILENMYRPPVAQHD